MQKMVVLRIALHAGNADGADDIIAIHYKVIICIAGAATLMELQDIINFVGLVPI